MAERDETALTTLYARHAADAARARPAHPGRRGRRRGRGPGDVPPGLAAGRPLRPGRSSVTSWLVLIARSRAIDRLRGRRVAERVDTRGGARGLRAGYIPWPASGTYSSLSAECGSAGRLQALPVEQRQVIELSFFRGLTQNEIALQTGTPLGTVKTRTLLAMKKLRSVAASRSRGPVVSERQDALLERVLQQVDHPGLEDPGLDLKGDERRIWREYAELAAHAPERARAGRASASSPRRRCSRCARDDGAAVGDRAAARRPRLAQASSTASFPRAAPHLASGGGCARGGRDRSGARRGLAAGRAVAPARDHRRARAAARSGHPPRSGARARPGPARAPALGGDLGRHARLPAASLGRTAPAALGARRWSTSTAITTSRTWSPATSSRAARARATCCGSWSTASRFRAGRSRPRRASRWRSAPRRCPDVDSSARS